MTEIMPFGRLRFYHMVCILFAEVMIGGSTAAYAADVNFRGNLFHAPCAVDPVSELIEVDMGTIEVKKLYQQGRTTGVPLEFIFKDCNTSLSEVVAVTFAGNSNASGLLSFDAGSEASGAVIGIETPAGEKVPVGSELSYRQTLENGISGIRLLAYVQRENTAVSENPVRPGTFTATMTYVLSYQ